MISVYLLLDYFYYNRNYTALSRISTIYTLFIFNFAEELQI